MCGRSLRHAKLKGYPGAQEPRGARALKARHSKFFLDTHNLAPYIRRMSPYTALLFLLLLPVAAFAQDDTPPTVEGYISGQPSSGGFDVDGWHVATTPQTGYFKRAVVNQQQAIVLDSTLATTLVMGEQVQVFGKKDRGAHSIVAAKVIAQPNTGGIAGMAVVQRVFQTPEQTILEADGYYIAISSKTKVHYKEPLTSQTQPAANMWIVYSGKASGDGLIQATSVHYLQFALTKGQRKMLAKGDGKLTAPNFGDAKGTGKKDGQVELSYVKMTGHKVKGTIPADAALQDRMQKIGDRLVPACQKQLAKDDPNKIDFRFYAFDDKSAHRAVGSPDGLVVIPVQIVEKLQNDDQIAAMLATAMIPALERQTLEAMPKRSNAVGMIVLAGMPFVGPLAGLALDTGGLAELHSAGVDMELQSERVGLSLMHDAGYDVRQAPEAWDIVQSKHGAVDPKKPSLPPAPTCLA